MARFVGMRRLGKRKRGGLGSAVQSYKKQKFNPVSYAARKRGRRVRFGMGKKEVKYHDYTVDLDSAGSACTTTVDSKSAILQVPQGDTRNTRDGDKIFVTWAKIKLHVLPETSTGLATSNTSFDQYIHFALAQKRGGAGTVTANEIMPDGTLLTHYTTFSDKLKDQYRVAWNKLKKLRFAQITRDNAAATLSATQRATLIKGYVPIMQEVEFAGSATASPDRNNWTFVYWSSEAAGGPTIDGKIRFYFYDM